MYNRRIIIPGGGKKISADELLKQSPLIIDVPVDKGIKKETEKPQKTELMKIGTHAVKNVLGSGDQLNLFSDEMIDAESKPYGISLTKRIDRLGVDLTDAQLKIMEGILKAFSHTNYQGNVDPRDKKEIFKEKYENPKNNIPEIAYQNIDQIPRIQINQSELLELSGINTNSIQHKQDALKTIQYLATTQFCFYRTRLAYRDGKPELDKDGNWKKEEVIAIDTLFTIKVVKDETTKDFKYYEIEPSVVFLDQVNNYFLLIPYNWREEVKALVGERRSSSYTFRFLLFLRWKFEEIRRYNASSRHKEKKPLTVRLSWEDIAIAIKMPETVYIRNRARAHKILDTCYQTAKDLGYISTYTRSGDGVDTLELNETKYHTPRDTN